MSAKSEPRGYNLGVPNVVIFDFDGTLTSRDSLLTFCISYGKAHPSRLLLVLLVAPLALLLLVRSQGAAGSLLLWALTLGRPSRELVRALRRYAHQTLPSYAHDSIFNELQRHVDEGSQVAIATGSLPLLVRELFAARQLKPIPIVGTRLRRKLGGWITQTHCTGHVKVEELRRRLSIKAWSSVYTNSIADRALIARAASVTLVNPSARTLRITQALSEGKKSLRVLRPT